jgi:Fe-S-cluster containining protein
MFIPFSGTPHVPGDAGATDVNQWFAAHGEVHGEDLRLECACNHLTDEGSCGIYDTRFMLCRQYVAGGPHCLSVVARRRTPEEYQEIREDGDPLTLTEQ